MGRAAIGDAPAGAQTIARVRWRRSRRAGSGGRKALFRVAQAPEPQVWGAIGKMTAKSNDSLFPVDQPNQKALTVRDVVRFTFKHKKVIVLTSLLGFILTFAAMELIPVLYSEQAEVLISSDLQNDPNFFSGIASVQSTEQFGSPANVANDAAVSSSSRILVPVIDKLHLTYDDIGLRWYKYLTDPFMDGWYWFAVNVLQFPEDPERRGNNVVLDLLKKSIDSEVVTSTAGEDSSSSSSSSSSSASSSSGPAALGSATQGPSAISITLTTAKPALGVQILNQIIHQYSQFETHLQEEAGNQAYALVRQRADEAKADLDRADKALEAFMSQEGLTTSLSPTESNGSSSLMISTPSDNTTVTQLKSKLVDQEMQLVQLREEYRSDSPAITGALNAIRYIKNRINDEQAHTAIINKRLLELQRDVETKQEVYIEREHKVTQISLFLATNEQQALSRQVIDRPHMPTESMWKKRLAIALGCSLGGILLGFAFAGLREATDRRFRSDGEAESSFKAPVFGIPQMQMVGLTDRVGRTLQS